MRRADREVKDASKMKDIIEACKCCRLGFYDQGHVYIVPMNFGYIFEKGQLILYFHSAKEGRKIDLIKRNPEIGFEMDTDFMLHEGQIACQYSAYYQSVIGERDISFIEDIKQKKNALLHIMKHYTQQDDWNFSDKILDTVCVFQVVVKEISCKEHR